MASNASPFQFPRNFSISSLSWKQKALLPLTNGWLDSRLWWAPLNCSLFLGSGMFPLSLCRPSW